MLGNNVCNTDDGYYENDRGHSLLAIVVDADHTSDDTLIGDGVRH